MEQMGDIEALKAEDRANKDSIRNTNKNYRSAFQKFGLVKYNAFKGMGGNLSFAMALLAIHTRQGMFCFELRTQQGRLLRLYKGSRTGRNRCVVRK